MSLDFYGVRVLTEAKLVVPLACVQPVAYACTVVGTTVLACTIRKLPGVSASPQLAREPLGPETWMAIKPQFPHYIIPRAMHSPTMTYLRLL